MKKLIRTLLIAVMVFTGTTSFANEVSKSAMPMTEAQKNVRLQEISKRVEFIREMDKSQLSRKDRKELRKEVKAMKAEAKTLAGGGVYLSVGAILIVILVLILIL